MHTTHTTPNHSTNTNASEAEFTDVTVLLGEEFSRRRHDTADLAPEAVDHFRPLLPQTIEAPDWHPMVHPAFPDIGLLVTERAPGLLVATFAANILPLTVSIVSEDTPDAMSTVAHQCFEFLAYPDHPDHTVAIADRSALLWSYVGNSPDRPLLATTLHPWAIALGGTDAQNALPVIADMETCLAAAYLTRHANPHPTPGMVTKDRTQEPRT